MSVVYDRRFEIIAEPSGDLHCSNCGSTLYEPYVIWYSYSGNDGTLRFCDKCCKRDAKGLAKDFVEINAAMEINRLDGVHSVTELRRIHYKTARKEREAKVAE